MPIQFRPIKVEHRARQVTEQDSSDINLENIEVSDQKDTSDELMVKAAVKKLGLSDVHDEQLNQLVMVLKKGSRRIVYVTSKGIQAIARQYVKSCKTVSYKFDAYHKDRPAIVTVTAEVITKDGGEFAAIGVVDTGNLALSVALKKAETNAFMRALRLAVGIPFYDEVDAKAVVEDQ